MIRSTTRRESSPWSFHLGPQLWNMSQKLSHFNARAGHKVQIVFVSLIRSPSFTTSVVDCREFMNESGWLDGSSHEQIVLPTPVERAVLNGIGKSTKIDQTTIQVAKKSDTKAKSFQFGRTWTLSYFNLHLTASPLAPLHAALLAPDDEPAAENLLAGLPILKHLSISTKTIFEKHRDVSDDTGYSAIRESSSSGHRHVSRLMTAHIYIRSIVKLLKPS